MDEGCTVCRFRSKKGELEKQQQRDQRPPTKPSIHSLLYFFLHYFTNERQQTLLERERREREREVVREIYYIFNRYSLTLTH
mmetsp:Transcript_2272/g.4204  ORF Transcript_2272/g.4204 Transcript_2272/m.4204 type:complete len:82 (+) Transcript_2272:160-405(+)